VIHNGCHGLWLDGLRTIMWTSPSGQTYTTRPGSCLLFPALCLPTGELPTVSKQYVVTSADDT
jgi:hypothetical protein